MCFLLALLGALAVAPGAPAMLDDRGPETVCFGAAAMDPARPACRRTPARSVVPTPAEAPTLSNSACAPLPSASGPPVCSFGAARGHALRTVALVGDSHAAHWRAALTVVAQARGWRGLSIARSSCPLQKALRDLDEPRRTGCRRWKREVFGWFERHPEVSVVFVAGLTGGSGVVPSGGRGRFGTSVHGYAQAWDALPATVRHIVVIRDTPKFRTATNRCIERAMRAGALAGPACALSRAEALDRDPAIVAAARMRSRSVQTVDLTRHFCDARRCYPVVGGALVLRDNTHVTGVFSTSLGPYLLRAVNALQIA
jgi:hypothetical protein